MPSNGLMVAGGIGQGLQAGVETYLKARGQNIKEQQENAQMGLMQRRLDQEQEQQKIERDRHAQEFGQTIDLHNRQLQQKSSNDIEENNIRRKQLGLMGGFKREAKLDKDVSGLSSNIEKAGLSELSSVLDRIKSDVGPLDSKEDIPGYGLTYALPDFLTSKEGTDARQAVGALRNVILHARSGGAVTPSEAKRLLDELGEGYGKNDDQLRRGIMNAANALQAKFKNITAGASPEAVQEFGRRGGRTNFPKMTEGLLESQDENAWTDEKETRLKELLSKKSGKKNAAK